MAVKDAIAVAGLPTRAGSRATSDRPAGADADCVAALRRAGARIVGTTALTELCWDESGVRRAVERGLEVPRERLLELRAGLAEIQLRFLRLLDGVHALALPTLDRPPPRLDDADLGLTQLTFAANAARLPAVSAPVPGASLRLVGRPYGEETLLGLLLDD